MTRPEQRMPPWRVPDWVEVLLRDRVVRVVLLLGLIGYLVYSLPLLRSEAALALFEKLWDILLILISGAAVLAASARRSATELERSFWRLWALGMACWLGARAFDLALLTLPIDASGLQSLRQSPVSHLLRNLLFVGLYLGPALAMTQVPHLSATDARRSSYRRLEAVGTVVLVFAVFVYFALVPMAYSSEIRVAAISSPRFFFFLDCYLWLVLLAKWLEASPPWRAPYGALAMVALAWGVTDAVEGLQLGGWVPGELASVLLDVAWLWPFVGIALAARLRIATVAEPGAEGTAGAVRPRSVLLLQIVAMPLVHAVYRTLGNAPAETLLAQRACVIVTTLLLFGLAVVERRRVRLELEAAAGLLERRNRELEELVVQLAAARDRAEVGDRAKSQFLANTSHEIRTPMHGVLGLADLLLDTPLDARQRQLVASLRGSADSLLSLIEEILDLSRIEAGRLEIVAQPFDPGTLVDEVRVLVAQRARDKGLELACSASSLPNVPLVGDAGRLRQVLLNLLDNAIKFTERGEIRLLVRGLTDDGTRARVRFEIADTGVGIPATERSRIFESFTQLDGTRARRHEGSGLGLTISRELVRRMGGEIEVESEVGVGSTFRFDLDFAKGAVDAEPPHEAPSAGHRRFTGRVLVAEDDPINQVVILSLLAKMGVEADSANNGREALAALERSEYDLVLMDSMMPGLDGEAAVAELRRREATRGPGPAGRRTPVAAVTASARAEDRERCLAAGMDDFLSKPFRDQDLRALLARWLPAACATDHEQLAPVGDSADGETGR